MSDEQQHTQRPDHEGVSLDTLSEAFAELLGKGGDSRQSTTDQTADQDETRAKSDGADPSADIDAAEGAEGDAAYEISPRSILEAMLFVGNADNQPLTGQQLASLMRGVCPQEIDALVGQLNETYAAEGCPYHVVSVGAGYRLVLREEFSRLRDKCYGRLRQVRLSQAAVDVLAIVAYKQPLSRQDVDTLRGKPSGSLLSQLVRRLLLCIDRPEEEPRRPRYRTTDRFLQLLGLESLDELPQNRELDGI